MSNIILPHPIMVFDVESIGLLGEGFAAGWVDIDVYGVISKPWVVWCHPGRAKGTMEGHRWVQENVKLQLESGKVRSPKEVRQVFWAHWSRARDEHAAQLAAEVPYPVEANFLSLCMEDGPRRSPPYPFIDIASVRFAAGLDPLETCERLPDELPAHNPLCDALQSARLLLEAMQLIRNKA